MSVPKARRPSVPDPSRQLPSASGLPARARTDSVLIPVQPLQPRAAQSAQAQDVAGPSESQGFTGVPVPAGSPRAAADLQEARNKLARLLAETLERVTPASQELTTFENHPFATYDAENVLSLVQELESFEKARKNIDLPPDPPCEAWVQDLRRKLVSILETRLLTLDGDHISLKQLHQLRVAMRTLGVSQQLMHDFETLESQVVRKRLGLNSNLPYATRRCEQAPMNAIGSGLHNTVYSTEAVLENGGRFPGIYKADRKHGVPYYGIDNASPNWGIRNLATSRVNQSLKFGVVVETHLVLNEVRPGEWEAGCIMEVADGFSPVYIGQVTMDVGKDIAEALKDPELLENVVKQLGCTSGSIAGTQLTLHHVRSEKDKHGRPVDIRHVIAVPPDLGNPELLKNISRLQLLDYMLIQLDRCAQNYVVKNGLVRAIDNDVSFCPLWGEMHKRYPSSYAPIIPRVIDWEAAKALLDYTPEQLAEDCMGLDPGDIRAVQAKLQTAKDTIATYCRGAPLEMPNENEPAGWIMGPNENWSTPGVSRALGVKPPPKSDGAPKVIIESYDEELEGPRREEQNRLFCEEQSRYRREARSNYLAHLTAALAYYRQSRIPVVTRDELVALFESRIRKDLL
jgi:hypothetical protein